jgi:hypothetical protein
MELGNRFSEDLAEAFEYFLTKQEKAAGEDPATLAAVRALTAERWVMNNLRKLVYDLLGEKRANVDG